MRQLRLLLFLIICLSVVGNVFGGDGVDPAPSETESDTYQTYTVKSQDTLYLIAAYFNTTPRALANLNNITNPNLIIPGQILKIPDTETQIPVPNTTRYTVQRGETLAQIAKKFDTNVMILRQLNEITNANLIFAGQIIIVPSPDATITPTETPIPTIEPTSDPDIDIEVTPDIQPSPVPTETPEIEVTPEEIQPTETPVILPTETLTPEMEVTTEPESVEETSTITGIEIYYEDQDIHELTAHIKQLDLAWVRVRLDWRHIEPQQGVYEFTELDTLISTLYADNRQILLTVTNAPTWARSSSAENGPPDDLSLFGTLLQSLLSRYDNQISAYQIWDEPNLRRNWHCDGQMCDSAYIDLLQLASATIWNHNPNIKVISAGLAPTRFNDSINAVDDRIFLQNQLENGLGLLVDGIGVHPGGEANPPDAVCCDAVNNIESHYENEVFYFLANLQGYHQIITEQGLINTPLWVTKFGWGTGEDVTVPSNPNQPHYSIRYTSLTQQAIYIPRALELGRELGYIEAMFINNLNGCYVTRSGGLPEFCFSSLLGADGLPRPVYSAVQNLD